MYLNLMHTIDILENTMWTEIQLFMLAQAGCLYIEKGILYNKYHGVANHLEVDCLFQDFSE